MSGDRGADAPIQPKAAEEPSRHWVDVHVGAAIRARRKHLKVTQTQLATALGLTFQQVQKYENGNNRISASKLWEIAGFLECSIADLFGGVSRNGPGSDFILERLQTIGSRHGVRLSLNFQRLSPALQRQIADLVETLAAEQAGRS